MNGITKEVRFFFVAAILASLIGPVFFGSCSQAAPSIATTRLRLVYRQTPNGLVEVFSFFVLAEDEDGIADLNELYLVNDRAELYWTLTSDDWLVVERSGQTWVGSHAISMNDGEHFPRGAYRAVLVDKGGERGERSLTFDAPLVPVHDFPRLTVSKGAYRITSSYPKNLLIVYDNSGAMLQSFAPTSIDGKLSDFKMNHDAYSIALWAEDENSFVAAITESVPFK